MAGMVMLFAFVKPPDHPPRDVDSPAPAILVFTKTAGFRHDSIPASVEAMRRLGASHGLAVAHTEESSFFTDENLAKFRAVVFLNTSGDVLDESQQQAFEQFIDSGGGFVGVHAASDTEYDWPWYGTLVGAYFSGHPEIQTASIDINNRDHPSTKHLPARWERRDEWYNFRSSPRERVVVLATIDETTYTGGTMADDHPIAWCHEVEKGRAWYTAGGHTIESYTEPEFVAHLLGGIQWAARLDAEKEDDEESPGSPSRWDRPPTESER